MGRSGGRTFQAEKTSGAGALRRSGPGLLEEQQEDRGVKWWLKEQASVHAEN